MAADKRAQVNKPELAVRVNNMEQAKLALALGVEHLYLPGDVFEPDLPLTKQDIKELGALKGETKLYLGMPRMMTELHFDQFSQLLGGERLPVDGLLVTNLGAIRRFKDMGYPMIGDVNLNVYNHLAAELYTGLGLQKLTVSPEMTLEHFATFTSRCNLPLEVVVHGTPALMYMEHDLFENTEVMEPIGEEDNLFVSNNVLVLKTDKGENPVYRDQYGRCHLLFAKELCYLPMLDEMKGLGISTFRIEGATYSTAELRTIITAYQAAIGGKGNKEELLGGLKPVYAGYTLGSLQFN
jgi:putative protease